MLTPDGVVDWALKPLGLYGPGYGLIATIITLTYLWLPYMILPIYAGLERLPDSLLDASADLGAQRRADLPLGGAAADLPVARGRLDLHVLADSRRLHHRADRRRQDPAARQRHLRQLGPPATCRSRPRAACSRSPSSCCTCSLMRRTGALENL